MVAQIRDVADTAIDEKDFACGAVNLSMNGFGRF